MSFQNSTFRGDGDYSRQVTKNAAVIGDELRFERAIFGRCESTMKFDEFELVTGTVVDITRARASGRLTYTLALLSGEELVIRGLTLFKQPVCRRVWKDEAERRDAALRPVVSAAINRRPAFEDTMTLSLFL